MRRTIRAGNQATPGASLRRVSGVNQCHQYTGELSLILDKPAKLVKGPGVVLSPLAPANRDSGADALQIFKGDTASSVFGLYNNSLGNAVVDVGSKPSLLLGTLNKQSLGRLRAFGLELTPEFGMAFAKPVDLSARVNSAIGVGGDIHDAEVDTQELSRVAGRQLINLAGLEKVESTVSVNKVGLAEKVLEKLYLACPGNKGDSKPPASRPDGYRVVGYLPGQDTFVIGDAAAPVESALDSTSDFVSISHLRQHPDHDLGCKTKAAAQVIVKQVVQIILAECLCLPGPFTDIVGGIVHRLQRIQQGIVLLRGRGQLDLCYQLHSYIIPQVSIP